MTGPRYELRFRPAALRQLRKLDSQTARRIKSTTETLRTEPRPPGVKALTGQRGLAAMTGENWIDMVITPVVSRPGRRRPPRRQVHVCGESRTMPDLPGSMVAASGVSCHRTNGLIADPHCPARHELPRRRRRPDRPGRLRPDDLPLAAVRRGGTVASSLRAASDQALAAAGLTGINIMVMPAREVISSLADQVMAGTLKADVTDVLPLDRAADGLAALASGEARGTIVVQVGS